MIAKTSLRKIWSRSTFQKVGLLVLSHCDGSNHQQKRCSSSNNNDKPTKSSTITTQQKKTRAPNIPSFMPVVNIPIAELAHNAFYSLHRPLLGLSIPKPFLVGGIVGQIKDEEEQDNSEEALLQYVMTLKPFEPPQLVNTKSIEEPKTTTTLTVEVDPSYFMNHNNNHDEIADYLTAMQEKLDLLYDQRQQQRKRSFVVASRKTTTRRLRKRKGFFEKN